MTRSVGTYWFGRHRSVWGIWQVALDTFGVQCSKHIKDVALYEEAVRETYRLNGWEQPRTIKRIY